MRPDMPKYSVRYFPPKLPQVLLPGLPISVLFVFTKSYILVYVVVLNS